MNQEKQGLNEDMSVKDNDKINQCTVNKNKKFQENILNHFSYIRCKDQEDNLNDSQSNFNFQERDGLLETNYDDQLNQDYEKQEDFKRYEIGEIFKNSATQVIVQYNQDLKAFTVKKYIDIEEKEEYDNQIKILKSIEKSNITLPLISYGQKDNMLYIEQIFGQKDFSLIKELIKVEIQPNIDNSEIKYESLICHFISFQFQKLYQKLEKLHDLGYAHSDIKPQNIVLGYDNEPYFIDFGGTVELTDKENYLNQFTPAYTLKKYLKRNSQNSFSKIQFDNLEQIKLCDKTQLILSYLYMLCFTEEEHSYFQQQNFSCLINLLRKRNEDFMLDLAQKIIELNGISLNINETIQEKSKSNQWDNMSKKQLVLLKEQSINFYKFFNFDLQFYSKEQLNTQIKDIQHIFSTFSNRDSQKKLKYIFIKLLFNLQKPPKEEQEISKPNNGMNQQYTINYQSLRSHYKFIKDMSTDRQNDEIIIKRINKYNIHIICFLVQLGFKIIQEIYHVTPLLPLKEYQSLKGKVFDFSKEIIENKYYSYGLNIQQILKQTLGQISQSFKLFCNFSEWFEDINKFFKQSNFQDNTSFKISIKYYSIEQIQNFLQSLKQFKIKQFKIKSLLDPVLTIIITNNYKSVDNNLIIDLYNTKNTTHEQDLIQIVLNLEQFDQIYINYIQSKDLFQSQIYEDEQKFAQDTNNYNENFQDYLNIIQNSKNLIIKYKIKYSFQYKRQMDFQELWQTKTFKQIFEELKDDSEDDVGMKIFDRVKNLKDEIQTKFNSELIFESRNLISIMILNKLIDNLNFICLSSQTHQMKFIIEIYNLVFQDLELWKLLNIFYQKSIQIEFLLIDCLYDNSIIEDLQKLIQDKQMKYQFLELDETYNNSMNNRITYKIYQQSIQETNKIDTPQFEFTFISSQKLNKSQNNENDSKQLDQNVMMNSQRFQEIQERINISKYKFINQILKNQYVENQNIQDFNTNDKSNIFQTIKNKQKVYLQLSNQFKLSESNIQNIQYEETQIKCIDANQFLSIVQQSYSGERNVKSIYLNMKTKQQIQDNYKTFFQYKKDKMFININDDYIQSIQYVYQLYKKIIKIQRDIDSKNNQNNKNNQQNQNRTLEQKIYIIVSQELQIEKYFQGLQILTKFHKLKEQNKIFIKYYQIIISDISTVNITNNHILSQNVKSILNIDYSDQKEINFAQLQSFLSPINNQLIFIENIYLTDEMIKEIFLILRNKGYYRINIQTDSHNVTYNGFIKIIQNILNAQEDDSIINFLFFEKSQQYHSIRLQNKRVIFNYDQHQPVIWNDSQNKFIYFQVNLTGEKIVDFLFINFYLFKLVNKNFDITDYILNNHQIEQNNIQKKINLFDQNAKEIIQQEDGFNDDEKISKQKFTCINTFLNIINLDSLKQTEQSDGEENQIKDQEYIEEEDQKENYQDQQGVESQIEEEIYGEKQYESESEDKEIEKIDTEEENLDDQIEDGDLVNNKKNKENDEDSQRFQFLNTSYQEYEESLDSANQKQFSSTKNPEDLIHAEFIKESFDELLLMLHYKNKECQLNLENYLNSKQLKQQILNLQNKN